MSVVKSEHLKGANKARRAVAAGSSVILASAIGVVTALVTARPSSGLWAALAILVLVGAGLQILMSREERPKAIRAEGPAAIAIGGSARGSVRSRFHGKLVVEQPSSHDSDVSALGPASIAIGQDAEGPVSSDVNFTESEESND